MSKKVDRQAWPYIRRRLYPSGQTAWIVDARTKDGGERKTFVTKGEAETYAQQERVKRSNESAQAFSMSAGDRNDAVAALAILKPHGQSLQNAAAFFVKHLQVAKNDKIVPELVDELLASKSKDGASLRYLKDLRTRLNIFAGVFSETKIGELSTPVVDGWLRDLPHSAVTRNNYRRLLGVLFSYAVQRGYCLENPIGRTSRAKVVDKPPGILNPDECSALLANAKDEILPAIALGLFAGLRPEAEIWRLGWGDIDFESGLIQIEAAKTKSARHRLVEMTENLKQWLAPHQRTGPVSPTGDKYNYLLQAARGAAGFTEWPQDCLRHCYGTYHYAKFQDPGKTMVQMGHTNPRTFHAHYRARVTPKDAARYWKIMPVVFNRSLLA